MEEDPTPVGEETQEVDNKLEDDGINETLMPQSVAPTPVITKPRTVRRNLQIEFQEMATADQTGNVLRSIEKIHINDSQLGSAEIDFSSATASSSMLMSLRQGPTLAKRQLPSDIPASGGSSFRVPIRQMEETPQLSLSPHRRFKRSYREKSGVSRKRGYPYFDTSKIVEAEFQNIQQSYEMEDEDMFHRPTPISPIASGMIDFEAPYDMSRKRKKIFASTPKKPNSPCLNETANISIIKMTGEEKKKCPCTEKTPAIDTIARDLVQNVRSFQQEVQGIVQENAQLRRKLGTSPLDSNKKK